MAMNAALPANEETRLAALRQFDFLQGRSEASFDRLARLASRLLDMPIAVITMVDEERQWFKSVVGLDASETSREVSFCAHAIHQRETLVVHDAEQDERFVDNPLVTGEPKIRFYAGAPITTKGGLGLGTLCVLDRVPRQLGEDDLRLLRDLADIVEDELELQLTRRLRDMQAAAVDHLTSGVVLSDPNLPDNPIVFCNPGFLAMTGYSMDEVVGRNCRFLQGKNTSPADVDRMRQAIADRETFQGEILNYRKDGTPFWVELTISPIFDDQDQLMNFVGLQSDITDRRELLDKLQASYERLGELEEMRSILG